MKETVRTPGGEIPNALVRDAPDGQMWSVDGTRLVEYESRVGAWELNLYCARAYGAADRMKALLDRRDLAEARPFVLLDFLQAVRQLVVLLPLLADVYEALDLPTSSASKQYGGVSMHRIVDPSGRVLRTFNTPDDWRDLAAELDRDYLIPNGVILLPGARTGAAPLIVWAVIALTAAIVSVAVMWTVGRVTSAAGRELDMLQSRAACVERWADEYARTRDPAALEALRACHEQFIALAESRRRGGISPWLLLGGLGLAAVVATKR